MKDNITAVKLISLTKEYRNGENYIRAVDDVSFSINEGEFIAVIGASGSGKSTLINLISGLEKPTHGCVYVHDVQMPDELSGGQQQRVAIARAVYTHPTILLGDELTGNLDSGTSISVMKLLKEICRQYKQTLLIVTHDENVAAMADRIICMKDGKVVKDENV